MNWFCRFWNKTNIHNDYYMVVRAENRQEAERKAKLAFKKYHKYRNLSNYGFEVYGICFRDDVFAF